MVDMIMWCVEWNNNQGSGGTSVAKPMIFILCFQWGLSRFVMRLPLLFDGVMTFCFLMGKLLQPVPKSRNDLPFVTG
jgi:hypothetical protein